MTAESLDDLVARLRAQAEYNENADWGGGEVMCKAADTIVALRARVEKLEDERNAIHAYVAGKAGEQIAALSAEVLALRTALRNRVIFDQRKFLSGNNPGMQCDQCGKTWRHDQSERHAPGCLAEQIEKDKGG